MQGNSDGDRQQRGHTMTRRELLERAALLGIGVSALPAFLEACGSSGSPAPAHSGTATQAWNGQQVTEPLGLSAQGSPRLGGELTWAWIYEPIAQLDPQLPTNASVGDIDSFLWVYDQLTNIKPGTLTNEPGLAESWEVLDGGLTYIFTLRDAEFSNGAKVTARDVKFSLDRFANPKINSQYAFLNAIKSTEVLNPKTVRVNLSFVQAMFPAVAGHGAASIVPEKLVTSLGTSFGQHPVGSGAFKLKSKIAGQSISFERNPNYWKTGQPYLDGFTLNYVPDGNARMLQVTSGQAQVGYSVPYALLDQYKSHSGTRLQMEPYTNVIFAAPNIRVKPFNDRNVRLALNYATPRQSINNAVFKGAPRLANNAIGELQYWDPSVPVFPYDVKKAKAALAKSSVPSGFKTTLLIVGTDSDSVAVSTILQSAWNEIGVKLAIQDVDLNTMFSRFFSMTNPNFDIVLWQPDYSSSDVGPDDELAAFFYDPLSVKFGGYFYNDPVATAMVLRATRTLDVSVRKSTFEQLQSYCLYVDPPIIPIAFGPARTLVSDKVEGLTTLLNNSWRLENTWLSA